MRVPAGLPGGEGAMHRIDMKAHINAIVPLQKRDLWLQ